MSTVILLNALEDSKTLPSLRLKLSGDANLVYMTSPHVVVVKVVVVVVVVVTTWSESLFHGPANYGLSWLDPSRQYEPWSSRVHLASNLTLFWS